MRHVATAELQTVMTRPRLDPRVAGSRCHHQGGGESGDHDPPRDGADGESHQCDNQQQDGGRQQISAS